VSAASGPYAAELSASSPKTAIPAVGPSFSPLSSDDLSGLPNSRSISDIIRPLQLSPETVFLNAAQESSTQMLEEPLFHAVDFTLFNQWVSRSSPCFIYFHLLRMGQDSSVRFDVGLKQYLHGIEFFL
jgi:hypothetical protein